MCQFFHNVKNRVILWCLLLYADARGPVEVFVAFLIWTPHFLYTLCFFFPHWFPVLLSFQVAFFEESSPTGT